MCCALFMRSYPPAFEAGRVYSGLVSNMDLLPTVLQLAGEGIKVAKRMRVHVRAGACINFSAKATGTRSTAPPRPRSQAMASR